VFFAAFSVLAVEDYEISDVVGENGSPLTDGMFKLLSVCFAGAFQLQNMDDIVAAIPQDLGKDGSHILIEQKADCRHQPPISGVAMEVLSWMSLSMSSLLS